MGTSNRVERGERTVEVDDRGRITIPKPIRERLGVLPGDELAISIVDGGLRLHPEDGELVTATSGKTEWGAEAFPDAGEAAFGGRPRERDG